ncbi:MAG: DUF3857 domain-containing protein [Candidatus Acidiferrales bacterium]
MKSEPLDPGAVAIFLYREIVSDDNAGTADYYFRIKILTDAGKKWATVEIPYIGGADKVSMIRARTIQPDGTIVPWQGKALDQTVVKAHGLKVLESTFSIPDAQVGSIIEYKYRISWDSDLVYRTTWHVTEDLFTRQLHCTMKPAETIGLMHMQTERVPVSDTPSKGKDKLWHFDAQDVPGVAEEDFMPPKDAVESKIDFYYTFSQTTDPDTFWKETGEIWFQEDQQFIGHSSAIRDEAEKVAPESDPPELRLRKLYLRAQQVRDLSHELEKTANEEKSEKIKDINSTEDVLKKGYAYDTDVNLFFIALARAAGFDASPVKVSERSQYFFNANILDGKQMDTDMVLVKLNGQDLFLDPSSAHCGFGELPWAETGVTGLKLDSDGGTFVTTTRPKSSDAVIQRTATLQMGEDGWLEGRLIVMYSGMEAVEVRQGADLQDDADRTKSLTDQVSTWLSSGATLKLTNQPDWTGSEAPFRAEFDVRTRAGGATTGHYVLLPECVFVDADLPRFVHPQRVYPVYFDRPWEYHDDVTLTLPPALDAGELPTPVNRPTGIGTYQISCTKQPGALRCQRVVTVNGFFYGIQYYGPLRDYFEAARNADQQQVMLRVTATQGAPAHP